MSLFFTMRNSLVSSALFVITMFLGSSAYAQQCPGAQSVVSDLSVAQTAVTAAAKVNSEAKAQWAKYVEERLQAHEKERAAREKYMLAEYEKARELGLEVLSNEKKGIKDKVTDRLFMMHTTDAAKAFNHLQALNEDLDVIEKFFKKTSEQMK